jgi:hypothetical protein
VLKTSRHDAAACVVSDCALFVEKLFYIPFGGGQSVTSIALHKKKNVIGMLSRISTFIGKVWCI